MHPFFFKSNAMSYFFQKAPHPQKKAKARVFMLMLLEGSTPLLGMMP
jgi:hypothetical protein